MAVRKPGLIALFDVDGTLTAPRKVFNPLNFSDMIFGLLDISAIDIFLSFFPSFC